MSASGKAVAALAVVGAGALLGPALLMTMVLSGSRSEVAENGCGMTTVSADGGSSVDDLTKQQVANAATIVRTGEELHIPRQGIVVALAAAHQESRFLNYANDGRGSDLRRDQAGIAASQSLPHEAVGSDHGSLGVFQQQWPWWGSMRDLMDPAKAAEKFYRRLAKVPDWEQMSVTQAAQAVQRSAYPAAYADDQAVAEELLSDPGVAHGSVDDAVWAGDAQSMCGTPDVVEGPVTMPIAAGSRYTDLHNFGRHGGHWTREHTGTDFSAACGTPVVAATDGTVRIRTDQSWAGPHLVEVSTGTGRLTTWYAHMQSVAVSSGQFVHAGERIGAVGALGNATGCHLHFEVHPQGGSIYQDDVDPSAWLETHVASSTVRSVSSAASMAGDFTVASFNVLGYAHTAAGGEKPRWADGRVRMRRAIHLLDRYRVDVVGLQELQQPQRDTLASLAGDRYAVYSPPGNTQNSVAWRRDKLAFVSADTTPIPYFHGKLWDMPVVRLRSLETGGEAIFVDVHNPADVHGDASHFRAEAVRRERRVVQMLTNSYDVPVFLTGDFNARAEAFCALTAEGGLHASAGGSHTSKCAPPRRSGIDWIFASPDVGFDSHEVVRSTIRPGISDHPLVVARASMGRED